MTKPVPLVGVTLRFEDGSRMEVTRDEVGVRSLWYKRSTTGGRGKPDTLEVHEAYWTKDLIPVQEPDTEER